VYRITRTTVGRSPFIAGQCFNSLEEMVEKGATMIESPIGQDTEYKACHYANGFRYTFWFVDEEIESYNDRLKQYQNGVLTLDEFLLMSKDLKMDINSVLVDIKMTYDDALIQLCQAVCDAR